MQEYWFFTTHIILYKDGIVLSVLVLKNVVSVVIPVRKNGTDKKVE